MSPAWNAESLALNRGGGIISQGRGTAPTKAQAGPGKLVPGSGWPGVGAERCPQSPGRWAKPAGSTVCLYRATLSVPTLVLFR